MDFLCPHAIDKVIKDGLDLDGTAIPSDMFTLYRELIDKEYARKRSGVKKLMRNCIVSTGTIHFDQQTLHSRLIKAGWEGLKIRRFASFRVEIFLHNFVI